MNAIGRLPVRWREQARQLSRFAPGLAEVFQTVANELEEAAEAQAADLLTLQEAAQISGYSASHLGRLVREGVIPNHGRKGAPRLRRAELPRRVTAGDGSRRESGELEP